MSGMLELVRNHDVRHFGAGEIVIEEGQISGMLLVLIEGQVEVLHRNVRVGKGSQPGEIFGEMSVLLNVPHTATVRAVVPSKFAVVTNPRSFLEQSPAASLYLAELLALRLDALNKYLADVKVQYEGHDHLGMVDRVLETLLQRQRPAVRG